MKKMANTMTDITKGKLGPYVFTSVGAKAILYIYNITVKKTESLHKKLDTFKCTL